MSHESTVPNASAPASARDAVEKPRELGAREVGVGDQAGAPADQSVEALAF